MAVFQRKLLIFIKIWAHFYIPFGTANLIIQEIFFVWCLNSTYLHLPTFGCHRPLSVLWLTEHALQTWKYFLFLVQQTCLVSQDIGYQIFATASSFYVPLLVILILYWRIFQTARKRIRRRGAQGAVPSRNPSAGGVIAGQFFLVPSSYLGRYLLRLHPTIIS